MLPICYRCKKSDIDSTTLDAKCSLDPKKNIFTAPFTCADFERTEGNVINYKKVAR